MSEQPQTSTLWERERERERESIANKKLCRNQFNYLEMNGWTRLSEFLRIVQKTQETHDRDTLQTARTTDLNTNPLVNDGNKELRVFTRLSQNLQEWKSSPNRGHTKRRRGTSHRHEYDSLFYTKLYTHRLRISPNVRILADNLHASVQIPKKHSMQEAASLVQRNSSLRRNRKHDSSRIADATTLKNFT